MNPFEMVVVIVFMALAASIIIKRMELQGKGHRPDPGLQQENRRLHDEMDRMQNRLRVLERIVTDRGAETAAQIDALREHERINESDKA